MVQTRRLKQEGTASKAPRYLATPVSVYNEDTEILVRGDDKSVSSSRKPKKKPKKAPKKAPNTPASRSASRCTTDGASPRAKTNSRKVKGERKKGKPDKKVGK